VEFPKPRPPGWDSIMLDRGKVKPRFSRANEAIEVWKRVLLKSLLKEEIVVWSKNLYWRESV
jgi:hypothetical protein